MSMSVSHPSASLEGGIRAMQLANYYLVESLDKEKSRLSYLCRVDTRYALTHISGVALKVQVVRLQFI